MEQAMLNDMVAQLTDRQRKAAQLNLILTQEKTRDRTGDKKAHVTEADVLEWHLRCADDRMSICRLESEGQFFCWTLEQILGRLTDHYVRYHEWTYQK